MKRTPLLFAAMVPLVAVGAPGDENGQAAYEKLKNDVPVTEIMGSDVENSDGKEVGEVEDVILGPGGEIKSVLVDRNVKERREMVQQSLADGEYGSNKERRGEGREFAGIWGQQDTNRMQRLTSTEWAREDQKAMPRMGTRDDRNLERTAGYNGEETEARNPHFSWSEDAGYVGSLTEIDWQNVNFNAADNVLRIDGNNDFEQATLREDEDFTASGELRASEVIGMEVNLLDDDSFGEVEDILVNQQGGEASAYIVDSMDYVDQETYALPARIDATSEERDEVNYAFTSREVEELGEFDLEDDLDFL